MGLSVPKVRAAAEIIAERFGVSSADALRVFEYFTNLKRWADAERVQDSQDPALIREALAALGVLGQNTPADHQKEKPKKKPKKALGRAETVRGDLITASDQGARRVDAETVADAVGGFLSCYEGVTLPRGSLPQNFPDKITDFLRIFCERFQIDDISKASAERWRGFCMFFGREVKNSRLLHDKEREAEHGGAVYDAERVAALLELWACLCMSYDKVPLAADFIAFSGVSSAWFYNSNGNSELTSARVGIVKKLQDLQEVGFASRLADGRKNPTGSIFLLKNLHGYKDQREVVQIQTDAGGTVAALPSFTDL